MQVAVVLNSKTEKIVPIVEGDIIRLYNTETGKTEDFTNPSIYLSQGKRGAVVKWAESQGITVLAAPPSMLCELSYDSAKSKGFHYYRVSANTGFTEFKQLIKDRDIQLVTDLPLTEIEPSAIVLPNE
ncbi:hypothetical protein ASE51_26585 [Bacillus sp. Root147]|nr:hypothetical protein ASE51_26585 [Bacillus sp. Root147]